MKEALVRRDSISKNELENELMRSEYIIPFKQQCHTLCALGLDTQQCFTLGATWVDLGRLKVTK